MFSVMDVVVVKEQPSKPSLEVLLKCSKIVSVRKECALPKLDNLKRILEAVDGTKFGNDIPVAMVAVIGPKGSGKSFLTNFIIQYLKQEGEGGWMSSLISQNGFPEGFSFGSISSGKFYDPKSEASCGSTSGVYLWPEPFLMTRTGGGKLVVWVMHVHHVQDDSKENLAALERFLMFTCSRIMEIKWNNDEEFRILQHSQFLSDYDSSLQNQICDSVVYTFRSGKKVSADTDEEAMETLRELLQEAGMWETTYKNSLSNCKHVNISWMNDISQPLHDDKGAFSAIIKTVQKPIRLIVDKMLEDSKIDPKYEGENQLTLGNMVQFVEAAANKILASGPVTSQDLDGKQSIPAAPMPEAANLRYSDQKVGALNNLLIRVVADRPYRRELPEAPIVPEHEENGRNSIELMDVSDDEMTEEVVRKDEVQKKSNEVSNELKLSKIQSEINKTVLKAKMKFNEDIEALLRQHLEEAEIRTRAVLTNHDDSIQIENLLSVEEAAQKLEDGKSNGNESDIKKKQQHEEKLDVATQKLEQARKLEEAKKKQQEENQKREQERQKKKEDNRRKEEAARSVMMDCFNIAVTQVRQIFPHSIELWIDQHFRLSTLNKMETIYSHSFPSTIEEHRKVVHPKLWNEFVSQVDRHCKQECISVLRSISEPVLQLNRAIKKQFDLHGYFNASKLEMMFGEEFRKLKFSQDEITCQLSKLAIDKLLIIYQQHNEIIEDEERNNFKIASSHVENLYNEQMKRYMQEQDAPYSPQKLDTIHKKLVEKLVDAFRKACHLSSSVTSFVGKIEDPLKEALEKASKSYETSNDTKLRKLQIEINKIILKSKMKYNEDIEAVLSQYPDGVELRILMKHNSIIQTEVMKLLEMEIRSKVREDEPVEIHQKMLQSHIDNYWQTVIDTNHKNIKRRKERDEEEQREKRKAEAQRKLQQQNVATERRKSATLSTDVPRPQIQHQQIKSNRKNMANGDDKPLLRTPLVFHLQSSRVVMAMDINGHPTVLENEFGEVQTPACVAYTSENTFVYGSEALALAHDDKSDSEAIHFWSVGDFFINSSSLSRTCRVCINGTDYEITPEFLLAILLNSLKEAAEHQMNGQFTTTVIAIPFSFSSQQRIQVKDAAKITGFSEVFLVNDGSAAAYNFVLGGMHSRSAAEILVLSENFDRVDAFVYSYNGMQKRLEMISHAGNYEGDTETK